MKLDGYKIVSEGLEQSKASLAAALQQLKNNRIANPMLSAKYLEKSKLASEELAAAMRKLRNTGLSIQKSNLANPTPDQFLSPHSLSGIKIMKTQMSKMLK